MTKRSRHDRWNSDDWSDWDEVYEERIYNSGQGPKRLRRNKIDGVLGGVCAGLGDYFGIDPVIVRVITVITFFFTGVTFLLYFLLWIFVPSDKRAPYHREYREARKAKRKKGRNDESVRPYRTATFRDVKSKYRSLETRLQDLERSVTSSEWRLRRQFRDLEN
jgi:phage shock protein C